MTQAMILEGEYSSTPALDRSWSEDAREIRRIDRYFAPAKTSYVVDYWGLKNQMTLVQAVLEAHRDGLDNNAHLFVEANTFRYAQYFLNQLPNEYPYPEIAVDIDGDIAIEWDFGPRRVISVRIGRDGTIYYAGLLGHITFHGTEPIVDGIPRAVRSSIERIIGTSSNADF